jgi:chromosomal replication initiator protein
VTTACVSIWDAVQNDIVKKIGTKRHNLWIKHTTLKSIDDSVALIGVPNLFIQAWLEKKFKEDLRASIKQVVGKDLAVKFVIDGALFRMMRESQDREGVTALISRAKTPSAAEGCALNPRYTFKRFVVGKSNRFACEMALKLAQSKSPDLNPLYLYGPVGLGKTHLLHAFVVEYKHLHPDEGVTYVTCEHFVNQFVTGIQKGRMDDFRSRYRNADVLVVDDIQWLSGKKASQQEFLHTFNALASRERLIVAAGDSYPRNISGAAEALMDRLASGITARIDPPDCATRLGIVHARADELKRPLPEGVARLLAERFTNNVRELEGGLLKILAFHSLLDRPLNEQMAADILRTDRAAAAGRMSLERIVEAAAVYYGLTAEEITSSRKTRSLCLPRHVAMFIARNHTRYSLKEIGAHFGNRSHASVLQASRAIEEKLRSDSALAETLRALKEDLGIAAGSDVRGPRHPAAV